QNNAAGISGVAPGTKVASQRIGYFDPSLNAHLTSDQWCYDGILMVNITGIVRLCPWTFNGGPSLLIDHAINISSGGDIIFPTGNNNTSTISYPGNNPNVTAVGAMSMCNERKSINSCDQSTLFPGSNYGPMTGPGTAGKISIVAPGVNIYTTDVSWGTSSYLSNFYGTSAAASFVAGIYAMIRSENWCMDGFEIRNLIEQTADKVGGYSYSFTGLNGSWDPEMGYGRINAGNALVWAHDIYRQNEQVNVSKSYKSQHKIFAGENVDPLGIKGVGSYSILSTTSINFEAVEGIDLEPGFEALSGSAFTAKIITSYTCTTGYAHFKGPKKNTPILKYTRPKTTESEDLSSIKIYPNPVNDVLHVSFVLDTESKVEFSIRNIMGQRIGNNFKVDNYPKGRNIQTLSTINLVPGVYIVDIKTNSGTSHFRFVKE
ncbi:MAG TPA: S8 family serine peptidase, partial [Flavipsychrobacter sp.]